MNEFQEFFYEHPSVLRTSYKSHEMFSYDINKANFCRGINYTDFKKQALQDFDDTHDSTRVAPGITGNVFRPKAMLRQKQRLRHIRENFDHFKGVKENYATTGLGRGAYRALE